MLTELDCCDPSKIAALCMVGCKHFPAHTHKHTHMALACAGMCMCISEFAEQKFSNLLKSHVSLLPRAVTGEQFYATFVARNLFLLRVQLNPLLCATFFGHLSLLSFLLFLLLSSIRCIPLRCSKSKV